MKKILTVFLLFLALANTSYAEDKYSQEYLKNHNHFSIMNPIAESIAEHSIKSALKKETGANFDVKFEGYTLSSMKKGIFKYLELTANNVKSEVYTSIEVTANGINNRVSSLDNKYTEIKQTVDSIDLTGKVSFTDLKTAGKTIINGANISTGTIAVDKLSSNNSNPIIKLFDNCAVDATKLNEQGKGTAIRLKMDAENYIKISQSDYNQNGDYIGAHTAIFSSLYPNHEVMMFQGNAHWGKIWTTQGIISTHGDNVYYGRNGNTTDKRLLNSSNLSNSVSSTASTVATSNAVKKAYDKAIQAYNIGNHSHPYASDSHNHYGEYIYLDQLGVRALGNGGSILMHSSLDGNNKNLGYSGSKFNQVSAKAVWGDTGSWSDKRTKENIRYLDNENVVDTKYSNDNITT